MPAFPVDNILLSIKRGSLSSQWDGGGVMSVAGLEETPAAPRQK